MGNTAFVNQVCQNIRLLVSQGKLSEAYKKCKEKIFAHPDEKEFQNLKLEIEKAIQESNQKLIKEKLAALSTYWEKKDYAPIIKELKELQKFAPENVEVSAQFDKAKIAYAKQIENLQQDFLKKQKERLEGILEKYPDDLAGEIYALQSSNPNNPKVDEIAAELKEKLITKLIQRKESLLNTNKFEDIRNFIESLKKISSNSEQISQLERRIASKQSAEKEDQKREYLANAQRQLETLIKLNKFAAAIKAADELLEFEPNSRSAKKYKLLAEEGLYQQTKMQVVKQMEELQPELKVEFQENKEDFLKL